MSDGDFDLSKWSQICESSRWSTEYPRSDASSPCEHVLRETWRKNLNFVDFELNSVGVDVFAFGYGESPSRSATKIGGLPYRPAGLEWPCTVDCDTWTFLAQFNFSRSRDLLHSTRLPGDVMLIFTRCNNYVYNGPPVCLLLEWYNLGITNLIRPEEVGGYPEDIFSCYGVQRRSRDYVWTEDLRRRMSAGLPIEHFFRKNDSRRERNLRSFACWDAVKIGGLPFHGENAFGTSHDDEKRQFLCTLTDVVPLSDMVYPWINQSEPSPAGLMTNECGFLIADGCRVHFYVEEDGSITWQSEMD